MEFKLLRRSMFVLSCVLLFNAPVSAQLSPEAEIRRVEALEKEALLKGDTAMLRELMSPQIVVQNPDNNIIRFQDILSRIRDGKIDYGSFERIIEAVSFIDNIAVVMGKEIIEPRGETLHAGKTVTRRFTNIWVNRDKHWKLAARQATIVSVD